VSDLTSLSGPFVAAFLAGLLAAHFGKAFGVSRRVLARLWRPESAARQAIGIVKPAAFLTDPVSTVWDPLGVSFGVRQDQVSSVHLEPSSAGGWTIVVLTVDASFLAWVGPDGYLVSVSKGQRPT
jgi:hypothetical protein